MSPTVDTTRGRISPLDTCHIHRLLAIEHLSFESPWCVLDFQSVFDDGCALGLGLELDDRLVGYAIGYLEMPSIHLTNLAVDPSRRRMGNATRLVRGMMVEAMGAGCDTCTLEVRVSNEGAQRLYRGLGFEVVDRWRRFYTGPFEDALIMYRCLSGNG
jgi:ribosomal-protein-alanine N-acetyltransferase